MFVVIAARACTADLPLLGEDPRDLPVRDRDVLDLRVRDERRARGDRLAGEGVTGDDAGDLTVGR
jgi:hypothetical protein